MTECARCAPISVTFISGPTAACTVPDRRFQYTGNQYALCTLNNFQTKVLGVRLRSCWPCRAGGSRRVTTCSQLYVPGWHMYRRVRHGIDSEYETNERHVPGWHMYRRVRHGIDSEYETRERHVPGWHMYRRVRHGIDSGYETNERQSRQGSAGSPPPFGEDQFCDKSACDDDSKPPRTNGEKKESMHQCARR